MNIILLVISLFLTIFFTFVNAVMWQRDKDIPPSNIILWAVGVLGLLVHYLKIW